MRLTAADEQVDDEQHGQQSCGQQSDDEQPSGAEFQPDAGADKGDREHNLNQ